MFRPNTAQLPAQPDAVISKNHDVVVGINQAGKTTLLGRGADATGCYSILFDSPAALAQMVESKKEDPSTNQDEWIKGVISKAH